MNDGKTRFGSAALLAGVLIAGAHFISPALVYAGEPPSSQKESKTENTESGTALQDPAIEALRRELAQMRVDYETRIAELESRLDAAEKAAVKQTAEPVSVPVTQATEESVAVEPYAADDDVPAYSSPTTISAARSSAFNPAIGVTFQGQAWSYKNDPDEYFIPGFPLGGETGPAPEGLSLAETEITMSANVDDKFTAMLTVPIAIEDGETVVELEEAWIETMGLPGGLSIRGGRFYSSIGYTNDKHFHSWDFADQNLVYQAFLGSQYLDDGLQIRWLAPTDFYLEFSGEILRGGRYPASGGANSGMGSKTLNVTTGGDVGFSHSWILGLSWLDADAVDRESGAEDDPLLFSGNTNIYIADFVWKWAPNGNSRQQNFKFQAEYLWRQEDGHTLWQNGSTTYNELDQQGWYAQIIYQPFPRWRFGVRADRLSGDHLSLAGLNPLLQEMRSDPKRYSLMVDWSNSEFSRLRFQYNLDQAGIEDDQQFGLQYIFSIGAHGGHSF